MTFLGAQVLSRPQPQPRCCTLRKANHSPERGTFLSPFCPLRCFRQLYKCSEGRRKYGWSETGREAGNLRSKFSGQTLPHSPPSGRLVDYISIPMTMSHKIRRLRDADHGSGNGRGPGRQQVTAGQPTSDDLAPSRISFRARTRAPLQSEVSLSWRVGLPLSP